MKKIEYLVISLLSIAIVVLFVLNCTKNEQEALPEERSLSEEYQRNIIVYVDLDSLLLNYDFFNETNGNLIQEYEQIKNELTRQHNQLERYKSDLEKKIQGNIFISQEIVAREKIELIFQQQKIEQLAKEAEDEFKEKQNNLNRRMADTILTGIRDYNKEKGYQIIHTNENENSTVFFCIQDRSKYNVTGEIIEYLNKRYHALDVGRKR